MFITPHTSAALWITSKITDPVLAFSLGLLSHFLMDMIPHGDDNLGEHIKSKKQRFLYLVRVAVVDLLLASLLILWYVSGHPLVDGAVLFGAVLGAWLPDLTWIAIETFKINSWYWYIYYHGKLHNLFGWQYSPVYGVPFQIVITLLLVKIGF